MNFEFKNKKVNFIQTKKTKRKILIDFQKHSVMWLKFI